MNAFWVKIEERESIKCLESPQKGKLGFPIKWKDLIGFFSDDEIQKDS